MLRQTGDKVNTFNTKVVLNIMHFPCNEQCTDNYYSNLLHWYMSIK